jgi:hypothetical protein
MAGYEIRKDTLLICRSLEGLSYGIFALTEAKSAAEGNLVGGEDLTLT